MMFDRGAGPCAGGGQPIAVGPVSCCGRQPVPAMCWLKGYDTNQVLWRLVTAAGAGVVIQLSVQPSVGIDLFKSKYGLLPSC